MPSTRRTDPFKPFIKRKTTDKVDHPAKKPKVVTSPTVGETPLTTKLPPPPRHGTGKGLMTTKGPVIDQRPPFFVKNRDMPLRNSRPSSRTMIIKTWATMQLRSWERRAFSTWLKCVTVLFLFYFSVTLISILFFILTRGADDEGLDGPLHSSREVS